MSRRRTGTGEQLLQETDEDILDKERAAESAKRGGEAGRIYLLQPCPSSD